MKAIHLPFDHANPYQRQLANALRSSGVEVEFAPLRWRVMGMAGVARQDVIHIHWTSALAGTALWKFSLGCPFLLVQLCLLRLGGRVVVWTVHNLERHEAKGRLRDRLLSVILGLGANGVIVHGESGAASAQRRFFIPKRKIAIIPHGNYIEAYPNIYRRSDARRELGLQDDERVLLFFGNIRPYKGVEDLIAAFRRLRSDRIRLVITGRPLDEGIRERIGCLASADARIVFQPGFVREDRIQVFMNAADVVVFPYKDILTSGAVVLAMSFRKACIAPRLGCIPDVLDHRGAFLYEAENSDGLLDALKTAVTAGNEELLQMGQHNFVRAQVWSWDRIATATLAVYRGELPLCFDQFEVNASAANSGKKY